MTAEQQTAVTGIRALALAKLLLTERQDLFVFDEPAGSPYDLIVRIRSNTPVFEPAFAVEVKGTRGKITRQQLNRWLTNLPDALWDDQVPLCLFAFDVNSRQGFYCWLAAPRVSDDGNPTLSHPSAQTVLNQELRPLDLEALDSIVHAVIDWTKAVERTHLMQVRAS